MCAASFQVILEGVRSIVEDVNYFRNVSGYDYEMPPVDINPAAISIMCITIGNIFSLLNPILSNYIFTLFFASKLK